MKNTSLFVSTTLFLLTSGFAAENTTATARSIDYEEASSFERSLPIPSPVQDKPTPTLFTQPKNKKEPCKLPTSSDQLARNNFRAYWDGQCKNGYAFGLGRDIAISDTHHIEEIAVHNGTGDSEQSPLVRYDFVNNRVSYLTPGTKFPQAAFYSEQIYNEANNFRSTLMFGAIDEFGNTSYTEYSPQSTPRYFVNNRRNIIYKFTDNSAMPPVNQSIVSFGVETLDPKTRQVGGVVLIRFANGEVRHLKINGASKEPVSLPKEYLNSLNEKFVNIQSALRAAIPEIERAKQMEREYLYMACNGKHTIKNLSTEVSTKICNWRNQFKDANDKSLEKYRQEIESLKQQAAIAQQQFQAQQQIAQQQIQAQQQIEIQQRREQHNFQQEQLQQLMNSLGQLGQQMQNSGQQMLNSTRNLPSPQINIPSPTTKRTNCINTGFIISCN